MLHSYESTFLEFGTGFFSARVIAGYTVSHEDVSALGGRYTVPITALPDFSVYLGPPVGDAMLAEVRNGVA